jgi:glycosyltransferase involved in cell wall biosynthesis
MTITFFFRKSRTGAYSIENLFRTVQKELVKLDVTIINYYLKHSSAGIKNRILSCVEARRNQGAINHITGDVNFITPFFRKGSTILTIHDVESLHRKQFLPNLFLHYFWLKIPIQTARWITVVSAQTKKKILEHVSVDPDKIVVIPNPVSDLYSYTPKSFSRSKPNVLQVGTKQNKNLENTIKALAGINCTLTIIGKLSEKQLSLLNEHQIDYTNKVGITNEQLYEAYVNADLVTFVSFFEGFGVPIIEANAVGRAVITSNRSSMPEVAGDAALLVDPDDIEQMRAGYLKLIEDADFREHLVAKGLENVKRFSPGIIAQKYLELYERMV